MPIDKYTVVQHSGFGYGGKTGFKQGLEVRAVTRQAEVRKVEKAGGILFDSYAEADKFCDEATEGPGIYPQAKGNFAREAIDGLRIYIPVREVKG